MNYNLPPPVTIKIRDKISYTPRIDFNQEYWTCGEHAHMCAHWLYSEYDPVYLISIKTNTFSHIVCYVKDVGTFDANTNKFFSNFIYGSDIISKTSYKKALPFIKEWPVFKPDYGYKYYDYNIEDILYVNISKLSQCHV